MSDIRLRRAIAFEAARLMYSRAETEYFTAKHKAARTVCRGGVKPKDLPSNTEIRDLIQEFARMHEGDSRKENLLEMRLLALHYMHILERYRPKLIGSVLTGHIRKGSDVDLHVFSDSIEGVLSLLDAEGVVYEVEKKQIIKDNESRVFTHVHVQDTFDVELTIYSEDKVSFVFKSSITGKAIERASIPQLEELLAKEYPNLDLDDALEEVNESVDPYEMFRLYLLPLDKVKQNPVYHPEGDVLYHLLQVFELARNERPYDEEFLLAALLHDIGKGLDPTDHVQSGLEALEGLITERTTFLIENHMVAREYRNGTLGHRQRLKLQESDDLEDLLLLSELDDAGRVPGARVPTVDEAIRYLRDLFAMNGE